MIREHTEQLEDSDILFYDNGCVLVSRENGRTDYLTATEAETIADHLNENNV